MDMLIRYRVPMDRVAENEEAVATFIRAVQRQQDSGVRYSSYRLSDDGEFMHLGWFADEAAKKRFQSLPEFEGFAAGLKQRAVEAPAVTPLRRVASSRPEANLEVLPASAGKLVAIRVSGKVLGPEFERVVARIEEAIAQHDRIRILVDVEDFGGMELKAFWEDLKFGLRHASKFERMAVIADQAWLRWWTKLAEPLAAGAEVRAFERSATREAWDWLRS